jgi:rhomboid protease GluP
MNASKAPITTTLVGMNVAVFAVMVLTGVSPVNPSVAQLLKLGANYGPLSLGAEPWRMLASNYIHGGIIHIFFNMWCLWNLGFLAERVFEPWTYVFTYTFSGNAGSLASLWWHPIAVGVGASGAIFGLAGALIAAFYLGHLPIPKPAMQSTLKSLLIFAGYNLFFGALLSGIGIDNAAHIGGLLAGLAIGAVLAKHLMAPPEIRNRWRNGVFVAAAVVLFLAFLYVKHVNGMAPQ